MLAEMLSGCRLTLREARPCSTWSRKDSSRSSATRASVTAVSERELDELAETRLPLEVPIIGAVDLFVVVCLTLSNT
ncbi:hypothetical protein HBB16_10710 [Pseudonocardia sp. MCCB 268]|nr:hypothetical protein [Pseudonocardia cytotoxica]